MSCRRTTPALLASTALLLAACGGDSGDSGAEPCNEVVDATVGVVAVDLAWKPTCLRGPADERFTIVIDNRDEAVNHNLHLTDAPAEPATELQPGPISQELEVSLPAGEYEFVCDIHPNMVGTIEVSATAGS